MFFILYKTTNLINNKIYIGIHTSSVLDDEYLGSGALLKKAIKKYGKENFKRETIKLCSNLEELLLEERKIVNKDFCMRRDVYNLEIGGRGGKIFTQEIKDKISKTQKTRYKNGVEVWNKGKKTGPLSKETKAKLSILNSGKNNPMYGIDVATLMTPEADKLRRERISISNRKPKQNKEKYSDYAKSRFFIVNKEGTIKHCLDLFDERLLSGEFIYGKIWKD